MFKMTVTVNYKEDEKQLPSYSYSSTWAMQDHIAQILREERDATSFVFVVVPKKSLGR